MANANIRRYLREAELWRTVGMMQQGGGGLMRGTICHFGAALDVHHTVITRDLERYRLHGSPARRHSRSRQSVTTQAQVFCRTDTSSKVFHSNFSSKRPYSCSGVRVSMQIKRRRLHEGMLRSRRPCIRIPMTRRHRKTRLEWSIHGEPCNTWDTFCSLMNPCSV
jgi:hypothetical protein